MYTSQAPGTSTGPSDNPGKQEGRAVDISEVLDILIKQNGQAEGAEEIKLGKSTIITGITLKAVLGRSQRRQCAAPAVIISSERVGEDGTSTAKLPDLMVSLRSGGNTITMHKPDGTVTRLCNYGWDRTKRQQVFTADDPRFKEHVASPIFHTAAAALNTKTGVGFQRWLMTPEAFEAAKESRGNNPGLAHILGAVGNFWSIERKVHGRGEEEFENLYNQKQDERELTGALAGMSGNMDDDLPF